MFDLGNDSRRVEPVDIDGDSRHGLEERVAARCLPEEHGSRIGAESGSVSLTCEASRQRVWASLQPDDDCRGATKRRPAGFSLDRARGCADDSRSAHRECLEEDRRLACVEGPRPSLIAPLLRVQTACPLQLEVAVDNRPVKPVGQGASDRRFAGTHQPHQNDVAIRGRGVGILPNDRRPSRPNDLASAPRPRAPPARARRAPRRGRRPAPRTGRGPGARRTSVDR